MRNPNGSTNKKFNKTGSKKDQSRRMKKLDTKQEFDFQKLERRKEIANTEDLKNSTFTIIFERNDYNNIIDFSKDFKPLPPASGTEFTLVKMYAERCIQRLQEEGRTMPEVPPILRRWNVKC